MQTCRVCKKLYRADHVGELLDESEWVQALLATCEAGAVPGTYVPRRAELKRWAETKGKKVARGLAVVRDPALIAGLAENEHDVASLLGILSSPGADRDRGAPALPELRRRPHRAATVQPDVRDLRRRGARRRVEGVPPPRDRPGDVLQLQERPRLDAREGALRHLPGRPQLPQRGHAAQLHLPLARVRADGAGVLRASERGGRLVPLLAAGALRLVVRPRARRQEPPAARSHAGRAGALREGFGRLLRRRVRLPVLGREGLHRARGHRVPERLRSPPAPARERREARVLRCGAQRALPPARHRAGGGPHARRAGDPVRGLHASTRAGRRPS